MLMRLRKKYHLFMNTVYVTASEIIVNKQFEYFKGHRDDEKFDAIFMWYQKQVTKLICKALKHKAAYDLM